ncbi:MAG: phosphatase PAP2 family protein [Bacteroidetes bacterium]|nr:phosphatase PAP2 family protein [Bacteroidota bacterium]MBK7429767.1 phosphatase PAP2 family protein [Bacteroidota bacterium]MBK7572106.1 phosphatase PAP2 family protein [Bacteroidota bacterium]
MIEKLKDLDADFVLFVNGKHTPFLDSFFYIVSMTWVWIPLYILLLYLVLKNFRSQSWLILLCIIILITLSDQFASGLVKQWVMRYRPTHNIILGPQLHLVNDYKGGMYGFISSHASNVFAITTFLTFILKEVRLKWLWLLWIWAGLVAFSRVYLGVHYLSDILGGALAGVFFGWLISSLFFLLRNKFSKEIIKIN